MSMNDILTQYIIEAVNKHIIGNMGMILSESIDKDFGYSIPPEYFENIFENVIADPSHPDFDERFKEGYCYRFRTGGKKAKFTYCGKQLEKSENGFFCNACTRLVGRRPKEQLKKLIDKDITIEELRDENTGYRLKSSSGSSSQSKPLVKTGIVNSMVGNQRKILGSGIMLNIDGYEVVVVERETYFILCRNQEDNHFYFCGIYDRDTKSIRKEITPEEEILIMSKDEVSGLGTGISVKSENGEDVGIMM